MAAGMVVHVATDRVDADGWGEIVADPDRILIGGIVVVRGCVAYPRRVVGLRTQLPIQWRGRQEVDGRIDGGGFRGRGCMAVGETHIILLFLTPSHAFIDPAPPKLV